ADFARLAFAVGGTAALVGALLVQCALPAVRELFAGAATRTPLDFRGNFLSFGSAWSQGFLEGGMVAFLSLYLLALGLTEQHTGSPNSTTMIGVLLVQAQVACP